MSKTYGIVGFFFPKGIDEGSCIAGNSDCNYNSKATITLYGARDPLLNPDKFGSKGKPYCVLKDVIYNLLFG